MLFLGRVSAAAVVFHFCRPITKHQALDKQTETTREEERERALQGRPDPSHLAGFQRHRTEITQPDGS